MGNHCVVACCCCCGGGGGGGGGDETTTTDDAGAEAEEAEEAEETEEEAEEEADEEAEPLGGARVVSSRHTLATIKGGARTIASTVATKQTVVNAHRYVQKPSI